MKRGGFLKRTTSLKIQGNSETSLVKQRIQDLVRAIVIKRDGGCIFRHSYDVTGCNGFTLDGRLILQADHLITRANSATYADTRLIVRVQRSSRLKEMARKGIQRPRAHLPLAGASEALGRLRTG